MNTPVSQTIRCIPNKRADVLLVDDDELVLRMLERVLTGAGYTVMKCPDGGAGVRAAMAGGCGVIVSDIHMPEVTGMELLRSLRGARCETPVILMTGAPSFETARDAVELDAVQYLTKPVDPNALLRAVDRARSLRYEAPAQSVEPEREQAFERALHAITMSFQPIVSLRGGGAFAYEALLRSREKTFAGPGPLLAHAEASGRMNDLGRTVRIHCAEALDRAPPGSLLFVNLHPKDLLDPDLYAPTSALAARAERVVLEITERGTLDDVKDVVDRVGRLRALGYKVAVDDLGAGYSGLTSIAVVEPDYVKLDMSLIRDIATSRLRQRLVASMLEACNSSGMRLIAEGVETGAELEALRGLGCDLVQGYHFARPCPDFVRIAA